MRTHFLPSLLFITAAATTIAFADPPALERPTAPAPTSKATFEARQQWCEQYASWLISVSPEQEGATPADVRPTHRFETEFNACKPDPELYEQQTRVLAERATGRPQTSRL